MVDEMFWKRDGQRWLLCDRVGEIHATVEPALNGASAKLVFDSFVRPIKEFDSVNEAKTYIEDLPETAFFWPGVV